MELEQLLVDLASRVSYLGNIYRGRLVNVEPSIGAAFVDFGAPKNGFLHSNDVLPAYGQPGFRAAELARAKAGAGEGPEALRAVFEGENGDDGRPAERAPIQQLLRRGQEIVVQVTKDGIGAKGSALTTYVSIPGRYLVLMPSLSRCGVSRKIADEKERRRLRKLLEALTPPPEIGFIIRTAGEGRTRRELEQDLDYLLRVWESFQKRLASGPTPALLYEETDLVTRAMRDLYTPEVRDVVVDHPDVERRVREFLARYVPRASTEVKLHAGPAPLFHAYGVEVDFERTFSRKVNLPSGGSIVFDQAEALVAIDVNSGRYRKESDLEETAFRTNLEAIPEVVRQMRLRDLGGQIVIDFIDMMQPRHRREVERALRDALKDDRARVRIGRIGPFGLIEMTRQRLGPGLKTAMYAPCHTCGGSGTVRTIETAAVQILREVQAASARRRGGTIEVTVHPDVEQYLANVKRKALLDLEGRLDRGILILADRRLPPGEYRVRLLGVEGKEGGSER
jgi:ribonuclease E